MGLSLRGQTSGAVDINAPAVAGDNTITLPDGNGSANQFYKNSTTAGIVTHSSMIEDANGNVGIGTDNPDEKFEVYGGNVKVDGGGNRWVTIDPGSNTTYEPRVEGSHELVLRSYVASGSGVKTCTFNTNGDLDLTQGRNLTFASGNGIDFSATANSSGTMTSELLDDYEEGTFTPSITFGGNSAGVVYTALRGGLYTKVGRQVHCYVALNISNKGSSTGEVQIEGLPFTATDLVTGTSYEGGGSAIYQGGVNGTIVGFFSAAVIEGQSVFKILDLSTDQAGTSSVIDNSDVQDSFSVRFVISYTAA